MPNAAEVAEKLDFSYIIGGVLRSYSYFEKWFGSFVKKKNNSHIWTYTYHTKQSLLFWAFMSEKEKLNVQ